MKHIFVPFGAYEMLEQFLFERGVELESMNFDSEMYGKYCKLMFNVIHEGVKAIEEFEAFDRAMSEVD